MAGEIADFSGQRFGQVNLSGARVHGAFLVRTRVTDAWVDSLDLSGNIQSLVVNGVEVAAYAADHFHRPRRADRFRRRPRPRGHGRFHAAVVDSPNGGRTTVGDCVRVVMSEERWHHRSADRDLAFLTRRANRNE